MHPDISADEALRLRCVELVIDHVTKDRVTESAQRIFDFVKGHDRAVINDLGTRAGSAAASIAQAALASTLGVDSAARTVLRDPVGDKNAAAIEDLKTKIEDRSESLRNIEAAVTELLKAHLKPKSA